jgi:hypothetical protein
MSYKASWYGNEIVARAQKASGVAIIAIGEEVSRETKIITHVITGNLRRSVHAAPAGYGGEGGGGEGASFSGDGASVEVGSWLPYACVEWVGRGHPGVTQGLEAARSKADVIVRAAFAAEGL